jgi:hypothetical protein
VVRNSCCMTGVQQSSVMQASGCRAVPAPCRLGFTSPHHPGPHLTFPHPSPTLFLPLFPDPHLPQDKEAPQGFACRTCAAVMKVSFLGLNTTLVTRAVWPCEHEHKTLVDHWHMVICSGEAACSAADAIAGEPVHLRPFANLLLHVAESLNRCHVARGQLQWTATCTVDACVANGT